MSLCARVCECILLSTFVLTLLHSVVRCVTLFIHVPIKNSLIQTHFSISSYRVFLVAGIFNYRGDDFNFLQFLSYLSCKKNIWFNPFYSKQLFIIDLQYVSHVIDIAKVFGVTCERPFFSSSRRIISSNAGSLQQVYGESPKNLKVDKTEAIWHGSWSTLPNLPVSQPSLLIGSAGISESACARCWCCCMAALATLDQLLQPPSQLRCFRHRLRDD